jgi:hypothetical protein
MLPITPPVTLNDINATARTISRIGNDPAMDLPTARDQIAALVARLLPDALAVSISKPGAADIGDGTTAFPLTHCTQTSEHAATSTPTAKGMR